MKKVTSLLALMFVLLCSVNFCLADAVEPVAEAVQQIAPNSQKTDSLLQDGTTDANGAVKEQKQPETSVTMKDIDSDSELGKSIAKLIEAGVVNGYPESDGTYTYRAGNPVTRGEFCKMINTTFGYKIMADNKFTDVTVEDWYYIHVLSAIHYGYIQGYTDGTFRGEDLITREEVCTILSRIVNKTSDKEVVITDTVSDWARGYVTNIIALGYMSLEEGGKFRATEDMTRGELAFALDDFAGSTSVEKEPEAVTPPTEKEDDKEDDFSIKPQQKPTSAVNAGGSGGSSKPSGGSGNSGNSGSGGNDNNDDQTDNPEPDNPEPEEPEKDPEPEGPTDEEIETSNTIYEKLDSFLGDLNAKTTSEIEGVDPAVVFTGDGVPIIEILKKASEEVLALRESGFVVSNEYVRETYAADIETIKGYLDGMNETPGAREKFEDEVGGLNTAYLTNLLRIFKVNINYGKE